jgi:hypothetical protein
MGRGMSESPARPVDNPVFENSWFRRFPNGGTVYTR